MSRFVKFNSVRFAEGYESGGPVEVVFIRGEGERGTLFREAIEMSVPTLLDREKVEEIVLREFRRPLEPHTALTGWPDYVRNAYRANRQNDGQPRRCSPTDDELRKVIADEIATDPTGKKYVTRGKPDPGRITKMLQERPLIPNLLPAETLERPQTLDDLVAALENEKVAKLAAVGWITRDEALRMANIRLAGPDPNYRAEVPGPCRLSVLFGSAIVDVEADKLTPLVADITGVVVGS